MAAVVLSSSWALAQDGDKFDGAIWIFTMKSKGRNSQTLKGRFRVSDDVLYQQAERGRETPFDKEVGKNYPNGKRTRIEMSDLRAGDANRSIHSGLKGKALLNMDRGGEWSGTFIDGEGHHWDFQCSRVQE